MPLFVQASERPHSQLPLAVLRITACKLWPLVTLLLLSLPILAQTTGLPSGQATPTPKPKPKISKLTSRVVLISIGGLQGLCVTSPTSCSTPMATLQKWRDKGAYAQTAESVYPSQTLPAHATMITGRLPLDHKIIANHAFDLGTGQSQFENMDSAMSTNEPTLPGLLDKAGLQTAAIGFPITSTDPAIKTKYLFSVLLHPNTRNPKDSLSVAVTRDRSVLSKTLGLIKTQPPHLLLVYFNALDIAQQLYGLNSNESAKAKSEIDGYLAQIAKAFEQTGLLDETTFIVTSDHGAMKTETVFAPNVLLAQKGWITTDKSGEKAGAVQSWRAIVQAHDGAARVLVKNPKDEADIFALLKEEHDKPDSSIWRIVTRQQAVKLGADDEAAFYLEAAPGVMFSEQTKGSLHSASALRTSSGQLPQRTEMRIAFVLSGRGIKSGAQFDYGRLTFIAPTIARLLGLEMRVTQGRVLNEVLNP